METKLPGLFIGTSGWSYKHWSGIFYPENVKPGQYLEHYLTKFDCVELNSSFYHLPRETTITGWIQRTPDNFKFCTKLSRFITHQKRLLQIEEPLHKYFALFDRMKIRLGPVLIQLPPGLSYDRSQISDFLNLLKEQYSDYRFALEVRDQSWITDDFFNLLSEYRIAFVIADSGNRYPYHEIVTTDFVYMRFHGREILYASDYSEPDLIQFARKITNWLNQDKKVWAFFNNDYHGYATKNAQQLKDIIFQYGEATFCL